MTQKYPQPMRWIIGGILSLLLISCGGGSGGGSDSTAIAPAGSRTGTVGILLTDKPADPDMFAKINASIERVELLGSGANGKVVVFSGPTRTFDLLRLRNESIPFSFNDEIPAGSYCKIRLILSDLELVLADDTPNDPTDNETFHPHLPGNGKLDLLVQGCFDVVGGKVLTIQVDIDAGNSLHIVENKKGFNFRPVILVDVLEAGFEAKLVRLEGVIEAVDPLQRRLLLCEAIPTRLMQSKGCVDVGLGPDAAFFDNQVHNGDPRALDELLSEDKVGERVTVVGLPDFKVPPYAETRVPEGEYPQPGECRIWEIGVEASLQAAPIDCLDVPKILPPGTVLVTAEGPQKNLYRPLMVLDGLAVELGDFLQVEGEVAVDADIDGFEMFVTSGGPVIVDPTLAVRLQPGAPGINGTRILSKRGDVLQASDIDAPLAVQVDGVAQPVTAADPWLKAALVVLDTDSAGTEQVTGSVLSVGPDSLILDPDADTVCGAPAVQLTVTLAGSPEILTVTITGSGSEIAPGGVIAMGQQVGMNGSCTAGGYVTDNIVIVNDLRP